MIDFIKIHVEPPKKKDAPVLIYPKFLVRKSSDLMIRGRDFYAVWIEEKHNDLLITFLLTFHCHNGKRHTTKQKRDTK